MDKFKKKLNLMLVVGLCLFASAFGIGVNVLTIQPTTSVSTATVSDDDEVSMSSVTDNGNTIYITNEYYKDGASQLGSTSLDTLNIASGDEVHITNSLIEFSSTTGFDNLAGVSLYIDHSIFVYTGSSTSGINMYSGTPTSLIANNAIFFASNGATVTLPSATSASYTSFYYDTTSGIRGYGPNSTSVSGNIQLGAPTTGPDVGLAYRVGFFAQSAYPINLNSTTETTLWNGDWDFSSESGWMFSAVEVGASSDTLQGTALYPYPREYVLANANGNIVTLYADHEQAEAQTGKVVIGLTGTNTITLTEDYALTRPGYNHTGWKLYPDATSTVTQIQVTGPMSLYASWTGVN